MGFLRRFYEFVSFDMDVSERTKQLCPFIILFSLWCLASHYFALEEKLIFVCLKGFYISVKYLYIVMLYTSKLR